VINADNSITFDLTMTFLGVVSNQTSYANAGVSVQNRMYMGSQIIMARDGNTRDTYQISINGDNPITFKNINLAPRASFNAAQLQWGSTYPNHEYPNAVINIGMLIFNPLYAWYVPMMTRKNSAWLPLNGNAGKILRRVKQFIAYAYSADGTDRFTTVYPNLNLNLLKNTRNLSSTSTTTAWSTLFNSSQIYDSGIKSLSGVSALTFSFNVYVPLNAIVGSTIPIQLKCQNSRATNVGTDDYNTIIAYANYVIKQSDLDTTIRIVNIPIEKSPNYQSFDTALADTASITIRQTTNISGFVYSNIKLEPGLTSTPWMPSSSEVTTADYPSYYGSYYGQGNQSQNASDYSWSPMISPIPQTNMRWSDFSIETQGTENQVNKGHNRRRTAGQFLQLPKLN
jgi:hypothetical protein